MQAALAMDCDLAANRNVLYSDGKYRVCEFILNVFCKDKEMLKFIQYPTLDRRLQVATLDNP